MKRMTMNLQNGTMNSKKTVPTKSLRSTPPDQKKKNRKKIFLIILFFLFLGMCGYGIYRAQSILGLLGINANPTETIGNLLSNKEPELMKDDQNRTNALIVGIDTRPYDPGLQNTDSIIVASFDHDTNTGTLISIPRDTWVSYPDNELYFTKINAIYNHCENQEEGTGITCLVESAETITNLDIQYYGMIDIQGLVDVIDLLGGVEVDVERSFTDYMFPTPSDTWEVVSFEEGLQQMDGETAMKYARSRHAPGTEGSDFARARRQQRLIIAIKNKVLSMETFKNPLTVINIIEELGESITLSDITTEDIRAGILLANSVGDTKIHSAVLDPYIANWTLITEDPSAAYVLLPKAGAGEWSDIHDFIEKLLENPGLYTSTASIYLYDGGIGYNEAYLAFQELSEAYPYHNVVFGGTSVHTIESGNAVYNFTEEDTPTAVLSEFSDYFDAEWTSTIPEGLTNRYGEDVAIILGPEAIPAEIELESATDTSN